MGYTIDDYSDPSCGRLLLNDVSSAPNAEAGQEVLHCGVDVSDIVETISPGPNEAVDNVVPMPLAPAFAPRSGPHLSALMDKLKIASESFAQDELADAEGLPSVDVRSVAGDAPANEAHLPNSRQQRHDSRVRELDSRVLSVMDEAKTTGQVDALSAEANRMYDDLESRGLLASNDATTLRRNVKLAAHRARERIVAKRPRGTPRGPTRASERARVRNIDPQNWLATQARRQERTRLEGLREERRGHVQEAEAEVAERRSLNRAKDDVAASQ